MSQSAEETVAAPIDAAEWVLTQVDPPARGPMRAALKATYPHLTEDAIDSIVSRAFSLAAERKRTPVIPLGSATLLPYADKPEEKATRGKLSKAEKKELHRKIRALLQEDPEISQVEAHRRTETSLALQSFRYHFRKIAKVKSAPQKRTAAQPVTKDSDGGTGVGPPVAAPKQVTEYHGIGQGNAAGQQIQYRAEDGEFSAEPVAGGKWRVNLSVLVDRSTAIQLAGSAWGLLYPPS